MWKGLVRQSNALMRFPRVVRFLQILKLQMLRSLMVIQVSTGVMVIRVSTGVTVIRVSTSLGSYAICDTRYGMHKGSGSGSVLG